MLETYTIEIDTIATYTGEKRARTKNERKKTKKKPRKELLFSIYMTPTTPDHFQERKFVSRHVLMPTEKKFQRRLSAEMKKKKGKKNTRTMQYFLP